MTARKTTPVLALLCLLVPLLILAPAAALNAEEAAHGEAAAGGEHGGGGQGGGGDIAIDYVKRVLNFGILMGVLVYFLRKPVGDFFRGRRAQIAQQLADLERARDEAKVQLREFENKLAQAAGERDKIMAEFIAQAEVEKSRILAEAEANANRIKDAARLTIEADLKAAKRELREELAEAAVELAAKKLEAGIRVDDHNRLIDEYLTKVVALK
jgi:F-type H+-transporting ATPase subunit b